MSTGKSTFLKKCIKKIAVMVYSRPILRKFAFMLVALVPGLDFYLKQLLRNENVDITRDWYSLPASPEDLSPYARQIHAELKQAIEDLSKGAS